MRSPYTHETIEAVWGQADIVPGINPDIWRKDFAGAWIRRDYLGRRNPYGWTIDHRKPISQGGSNAATNLMPIHWQNSECRNDAYPEFTTCLSSEGNRNIEQTKSWQFKV